MTTYKRVDGDYVITTINSGDTVTLATTEANFTGNINVTGSGVINGDLTVVGNLNASGNIAGDKITNGSTSIEIPSPGGNANISVGGVGNVAVFTTDGANITANITATGNVTGGNLKTSNAVVAGSGSITGNLTAGNLSATLIAGTLSTAAQPNITSVGTLSSLTVSGNIAGGNVSGTLFTGTLATAAQPNITSVGNLTSLIVTGNSRGANILTAGQVIAVGNIATAGKFLGDGSLISNISVANITGVGSIANGTSVLQVQEANGVFLMTVNGTGNVIVFGETYANYAVPINTTGNVNANYFLGNGSLLSGIITSVSNINNGTSEMSVISSGGNIRGNIAGNTVLVLSSTGIAITGNISTTGSGGDITGTGNISANYFLGNGSQLSGIITSVASMSNGTSNVNIATSGGNVTTSVGGTANVVIVTTTGANITGTLNATGNANVGNLGATNIAGTLETAAQTNITSVGTLTSLSVTGNVSGGNLSGTNIVGTLTTASQTNITSVGTLGSLSVTGNASAGNISVSTGTITGGNIVNSNANGVGNIGSSTTYFNTVFAKATSAQYADLAEIYLADKEYEPGTVLRFGGEYEVTECNDYHDHRVAGVVSTNPAHLMNAGHQGAFPVKLALVGRVPCRVRGPVTAGDILVSAGLGWAKTNNQAQAGRIIGKSLENSEQDATIEIVVGKH